MLTRLSGPSESLLSLSELKDFLRVEHGQEDALITAMGAAAEQRLDGPRGILARALVSQQWQWDTHAPSGRACVRMPLVPVASIDAVELWSGEGVLTAFPSIRLVGGDPEAWMEPTAPWLGTDGRAEALRVTFTAGYATAADVPAPIHSAALLIAGTLYEHREDVATASFDQLPLGARALVWPYGQGPL